MVDTNAFVQKESGEREPFFLEKLRHSLERVGAKEETIVEIINNIQSLHSYFNIEKEVFFISSILYVLFLIVCIETMPKYPPNECRGLHLNSLNSDYKCKKTGKLYKRWTFDDIYDWNLAQDKNEFLVVQCYECSRFQLVHLILVIQSLII